MFNVHDEPESPNVDEPESPNEGACFLIDDESNREMRGHI